MSGGPSYKDEYDDFMGGEIDSLVPGKTNAEKLNRLFKDPEAVAVLMNENPELFKLIREKHPRLMELIAKRENLINAGGADIEYKDMQTKRPIDMDYIKHKVDYETALWPMAPPSREEIPQEMIQRDAPIGMSKLKRAVKRRPTEQEILGAYADTERKRKNHPGSFFFGNPAGRNGTN